MESRARRHRSRAGRWGERPGQRPTGLPGALIVGLALLFLPGALAGQSAEELRARYLLPVRAADADDRLLVRPGWTVPAMGGNSPTGYGADWGVVYVAGSFQERTRFSEKADATAALGAGLGDAREAVGLEVRLHSFSTFRSHFFETGGLDLHLHRQLPGGFGLALGWESALHWGGGDSGSNPYGVVSKWFALKADDREPLSALSVSAGVGGGRFQSEEAWRAGEDGVGVFGSLALRVAAPVSVVVDWTGQDLMLATSVAPLRELGLVVTGGVADVAGRAGDGARWVMAASFSHDFRGR